MDNKQQDALDTEEFADILEVFWHANIHGATNWDSAEQIKIFIRANFEPKKEQSNDKT